ncbi:flagellar hook-basal body complex protein FliE [Terrilactibacillus tamarindi]|nr:flagellar hook-basal body complex protein FliE [Terrilactibacillus tamarindi]
MDISAINMKGLQNVITSSKTDSSVSKTSTSFSNVFDKAISALNESQKESDQAVTDLISGKNQDLHNVMISLAKSDVLMQTASQFRNKAIDAYQEIMRMQV